MMGTGQIGKRIVYAGVEAHAWSARGDGVAVEELGEVVD